MSSSTSTDEKQRTDELALPSVDDPFVRETSEGIGGPPGEHALDPTRRGAWLGRARGWWTPLRIVLAVLCLTLLFGWIQKSPCNQGDWGEGNQRAYSYMCYSDYYALYFSVGFSEGNVPYADHPLEYPVLTGAMMAVVGVPLHKAAEAGWLDGIHSVLVDLGVMESETPNEGVYFYWITSFLLALCAVAVAIALVRLRPRRPFDAIMFAASPVLIVTAFVNYDLWALSLSTLAILFWAKKHYTWAGVLLGLAVAAKFYPVLFLLPLFVLCLRAKRISEFTLTASWAVISWVAVNLPVLLLTDFDSWVRFYTFSQERGVDWGTFWYIGQHWPLTEPNGLGWFHDIAGDITTLNDLTTGFLLLASAGIAALALLAPRRPRLAQLLFLIVAVFLLTNKVWSQQFVLWLIPLVILARPRWGAFIVWQISELFYFLSFYQIMLTSSDADAILPSSALTWAALFRWWSVAVLCGLIVYDILRPERDVLRNSDMDDPDGGVLDKSADASWLHRVHRRLGIDAPRESQPL